MNNKNNPRILFFDIESILLLFYAFSTGKQVLRHNQLMPGKSRFGIISISYCWNKGAVKTLEWDPVGRQEKLIADFDEIVKQADHIIGKNSDRFDNKMINGIRLLNGQPGLPEWVRYTDDLEKQMRRYFRLPSQSLDYISYQLGLGGKIKMDFADWVAIDQWMTLLMLREDGMDDENLELYCQHMYCNTLAQILKLGEIAFKKMNFYGAKDVRDTRTIWNKVESHVEPRFNTAAFYGHKQACKRCAGYNVVTNKTGYFDNNRGKVQGNVKYIEYHCNDCNMYAGRHSFSNSDKARKLV